MLGFLIILTNFAPLALGQKTVIDGGFLNSIRNWDQQIIDAAASSTITSADLYSELASAHNVILGEWHYNSGIQQQQAATIIGTINAGKMSGTFTLGWEFLNISEQGYIDNMYSYFKKGRITAEQQLINLIAHPKHDAIADYIIIINEPIP